MDIQVLQESNKAADLPGSTAGISDAHAKCWGDALLQAIFPGLGVGAVCKLIHTVLAAWLLSAASYLALATVVACLLHPGLAVLLLRKFAVLVALFKPGNCHLGCGGLVGHSVERRAVHIGLQMSIM